MHKKYHEKFKILGILAVTTQAREGIETAAGVGFSLPNVVTTQAREGIETKLSKHIRANGESNNSSP